MNELPSQPRGQNTVNLVTLGAGAGLGILIGLAIGWNLRGAQISKSNLVADTYVPIQAPLRAPEAPVTTPKPVEAAKSGTTPVAKTPPNDPSVSRLPIPGPLQGSLEPFRPDSSGVHVPGGDLHSAEAKIRVLVSDAGGRIVSAADSESSGGPSGRILLIRIAKEKSSSLATKIRTSMGPIASVSESFDPGFVNVQDDVTDDEVEITKKEAQVLELKKKRTAALRDFTDDAPIIKDLDEELNRATKELADMKVRSKKLSYINVTLHS